MSPVIRYIVAFAWGFVLLLSFAGWGLIVGRLLRDELKDDWGQAIARGISLMVIVGGGLNLFHLISDAMVLGLVVTGLIALVALAPLVAGSRTSPEPRSPLLWVAWISVLLSYINWLYFFWPSRSNFIPGYSLAESDDQVYAVHPIRMLQTGSLGVDPFNMSQTSSSLGGEAFLQTFVRAILPTPYLHVLDPGVSYLAMAVMLGSMVRRRWLAAALILLYLSIPSHAANCTAIGLPVVLLMAIYREWSRGGLDRDPVRSAVAVSLPLAALLTLKTTLVPGAAAIVFFERVFAAFSHRRVFRPLAAGLLTGGLTLLLLLPWMISSYASCGSLFYPFLGEGYRAHSAFAMPHKQLSQSPRELLSQTFILSHSPPILGCLVFGLLAAWARRGDRALAPTRTFLGCLAGSLAYLGLTMVVFSICDSVRYSYPFRAFLLVLSFAFLLGYEAVGSAAAPARRRIIATVVWLGLAGLIVHGCYRNIQRSRLWVVAAESAMTGLGLIKPAQLTSYRQLQDALPRSAKILFVAPDPFLLDFRRNDLFVCDRPGAVSPPPGLPLDGTSEDIATYLRSLGIRYVVCGSDAARLSDTALDEALLLFEKFRTENLWLFHQNISSTKFLIHIKNLCNNYYISESNDYLLVIDLTRRLADGP